MEIRKRFQGDIAVLYVEGKIDIDGAALIEETGQLVKDGITKILCDFSNVDIVDYNGLSILAIAYKNVVNQKGSLKFCSVPMHIKELLKAARLDMVFEIYEDEDTALRNFDLSSKLDTLSLRRRFKRIDVGMPIKYKTGLSSDIKFYKGKILNISGEGIYVLSNSTFPAATQLYIEIGLAEKKEPLTLMGVVVWLADKELQPHSYPGMGIKFMDIDKNTQSEIINYIDKHLTRRSKI